MSLRFRRLAISVTLSALCAAGQAHVPGGTVEVHGHYDNSVGSSDAASQGVIGARLLKSRPALRPGEVLEFVPGLIVTQHSGDGKANQYFLRGFNLDHGTDFASTVAGMPVNMPSHGHGQGYTDLNFLIPELVQRIDYFKGPYHATHGDFASAGAADIHYRPRLEAPLAQLTIGQHGHRRGLFGASTGGEGGQWLGALELARHDGPWSVPSELRKHNGVLSYATGNGERGFSASLMAYDARWRSTDQVPQRLIESGRLPGSAGSSFGRFDSLDDSDGGRSSRASLSGQWYRNDESGRTVLAAYAIRYRMQLWSNFTYALERPDAGDQFAQTDRRWATGLKASHGLSHLLGSLPARTEFGLQWRGDRVDVALADTARRQALSATRDDHVRLWQFGAFVQSDVELHPAVRAVIGLRADAVRHRVASLLLAENSGRAGAALLSPKLSVIAGPFAAWPKTEFFVNAGRGFHSNDARGTTARIDPKSGEPVDKVPPLVASRGFEVGARTEVIAGLQSSLALWRLDFDSELVYIGDAGATEASEGSRRRGLEFNNRWMPVRWFLLDADFAWSHARLRTGERIPNAVDRVASLAMTVRELGPWSASLQWRYLGSAALVEDNSVRSKASLTSNLRISRKLGEKAEWTLDVFNLADRPVNDIQYFYESRLPGEAAAVTDRHVHPAEPRSLRLTLALRF